MVSALRAVCDLLPARAMPKQDRPRLNRLVKCDLAEALGGLARTQAAPYYEAKGRTGREIAWAHCPWVGVHDRRVPSKARTGLYAALLFAVDGSSVVLSLQLGSGSRTRRALAATADRLRAAVACPEGFSGGPPRLVPPALRPRYDASLSPYAYEIASVWAAAYPRAALGAPGVGEQLSAGLLRLLGAYGDWASRHQSGETAL